LPPDGPNSRRFSKRRSRFRPEQERQRGWKLYSFHAAEVECIGRARLSALRSAAPLMPLTGCVIERAPMSEGLYRDHDAANPRRVFISGQKRGVFGIIKPELRLRSTIEPVIGQMKTDGHLGRCHLKDREGDPAKVTLTAVGHNFLPCSRLA
jgi:transposase, IS5 family